MQIRPISEWTLYKFRFWLGYLLLAAFMVTIVIAQLDSIPPGLGPSEQQSVLASASINFEHLPTNVVDLPYHIVQKFSVDIFGVTPLGVRLPSLIFGSLAAIIFALILRRWFNTNVAIVAALVVLSSAWFVATLRLGAPLIMVPFWTSLILLAATYIAQETKHWKLWKVGLAFAAAISLYTPFMVYIFIAALLASASQPHLRYLVKRSSKFALTVGSFFFAALLLPLGWGIYKNWQQMWDLLAMPQNIPGPIDFANNLANAASNLVNPYNAGFGEMLTPLVSLASLALLFMGAARLLRDSHSVRSHLLLFWAAVLVPVVALNPNNLIVLLVPVMLVMAIGVHLIINYWYRLFPRNPYARVFGLIPLAVLIAVIVHFNYQQYMYGMMYSQQAASTFNNDVFLAQKELAKIPSDQNVSIVVLEKNLALYELLAKQHPNAKVLKPDQADFSSGSWIISKGASALMAIPADMTPSQVIVNDHSQDGLRFLIYQR
jgi:hypothetical protein